MSQEQNGDTAGSHTEADFAAAMKELQRGEKTAAALENHLDSLEKKIEELLAQADKAEQELKAHPREDSEQTTSRDGKGSS